MQMFELNPKLRELLIEKRKANPERRFLHLFYHYRNGSRTAQMACALCEEGGPTWANEWRKTKYAKNWESSHRAIHEAEVSAE